MPDRRTRGGMGPRSETRRPKPIFSPREFFGDDRAFDPAVIAVHVAWRDEANVGRAVDEALDELGVALGFVDETRAQRFERMQVEQLRRLFGDGDDGAFA